MDPPLITMLQFDDDDEFVYIEQLVKLWLNWLAASLSLSLSLSLCVCVCVCV